MSLPQILLNWWEIADLVGSGLFLLCLFNDKLYNDWDTSHSSVKKPVNWENPTCPIWWAQNMWGASTRDLTWAVLVRGLNITHMNMTELSGRLSARQLSHVHVSYTVIIIATLSRKSTVVELLLEIGIGSSRNILYMYLIVFIFFGHCLIG